MKKAAVGWTWVIVWTCAGLAIAATASSALLYQRNQLYQNSNRELILQNDSLMSVTIELQKALQHKPDLPGVSSTSEAFTSRKSK